LDSIVKIIPPHDRPREKLARVGAAALGDNELLAIVLAQGMPRASALELANAVLAAAGGLHGLVRTTVDDLRRVRGIGTARASQIVAAIEVGRRTLVRGRRERVQVLSARDVAELLVPQFGSRPVEQFGVILLDTKHRVLRTSLLSIGTLDASIVHPREVFREAASGGAAAIIVFHNHPSGDPLPSPEDVALTRRLIHAGEMMGIDVLDHVIIAENRFHSMRDAGDLNPDGGG
jgi:DNA repair protein RadC